ISKNKLLLIKFLVLVVVFICTALFKDNQRLPLSQLIFLWSPVFFAFLVDMIIDKINTNNEKNTNLNIDIKLFVRSENNFENLSTWKGTGVYCYLKLKMVYEMFKERGERKVKDILCELFKSDPRKNEVCSIETMQDLVNYIEKDTPNMYICDDKQKVILVIKFISSEYGCSSYVYDINGVNIGVAFKKSVYFKSKKLIQKAIYVGELITSFNRAYIISSPFTHNQGVSDR